MVTTDLTPQQCLELQFKASSSNDLMDDGLRTIRGGRLTATNRDQVLASLAAGLTRLYTLALDLHRLELDRLPERPDSASFHDLGLADLHARLFDILGLHPERSDGEADQLLCRLSADPVVTALVEALDAYRDLVAGAPSDPEGAWDRVRAAVNLDPGVCAHRTPGSPAYEEAWRNRLVSTIETVRAAIDACSQDGLLGGPARNLGVELSHRRRGPVAA